MSLALSVSGWGWLQLFIGLIAFLAPGYFVTARWVERPSLTPLFSFALYTVTALVGDFVLGLPVTTFTTYAIGFAWTAAFAWKWKPQTIDWKPLWPLLLIIPFVALAQAVPHIPGDDPSPAGTYPELAERAWHGISGETSPYPIHVDEYIRMAKMSDVIEEKSAIVGDPYTGTSPSNSMFSISGLRDQNGYNLAIAQVSLLTGASLPTIARFMPALWAGYTAAVLFLVLRPMPGAAYGAAFAAIAPNNARFLGSGYMVPSNFALPWILAMFMVAKAPAKHRFAAQALLVTACFSFHIVIGTLAIFTLLMNYVGKQNIWNAAAATLPLLWLVPSLWRDANAAVFTTGNLQFYPQVISDPGVLLYIAAGAGLLVAIRRKGAAVRLGILALLTLASILWSLEANHANDATYTRIFFAFLLATGALAGIALGSLQEKLGTWGRPLMATACLLLMLPGLHASITTDMYQIHDEETWAAQQAYVAIATDDDVFLTEPWEAPPATFGTQAKPWSVLYPGRPPVNGPDYEYYRETGANEQWFKERGITHVIGPEPNAPAEELAPNVWKLKL